MNAGDLSVAWMTQVNKMILKSSFEITNVYVYFFAIACLRLLKYLLPFINATVQNMGFLKFNA
jgi:hypothetical protein